MRVLVTGGAGYVGSHACKALAAAGHVPIAYDDLRRGNRWAVRWGPLIEAPLEDRVRLIGALREHEVAAVMHFAAYAYVSESMTAPALYFSNNVTTAQILLDAIVETGVRHLVLSSSCGVYGDPKTSPITEATPLDPINPYGASKAMVEEMARWYAACHGLTVLSLRYFNAAGADPDGEIGEHHTPETRLVPLVIDAALGRGAVTVNGTDYPTPDGTAIRDYVHVSDLAEAHLLGLRMLTQGGVAQTLNLGSGSGASIRQVIDAVAAAAGRTPEVVEGPRRPGDPPVLVADIRRAQDVLSWRPHRSDLATLAATALRWRRDILPTVNGNAGL